ncbi:MAG: DNA polymerase I [bacterium]
MAKARFYIIDGNAYIHRAFHALPPLTNSKGQLINAVYGFTRMLLKIIKREQPDYLAVCFDSPHPTFRHEAFSDYKANRKKTPDELKTQIPLAHEVVEALNISSFAIKGYEADDIIATLARKGKEENMDTFIVTGDKDALQLVDDTVFVLNEAKNIIYDEEKVKERFGVEPAKVIEVMGLAGDSSDNVPGVPGVGEKTAIKLITKFGSIEHLLENISEVEGKLKDKLSEFSEQAKMSRQLVTLDHNVPVEAKASDCGIREAHKDKMIELFGRLEFKTLLSQISSGQQEDADYRTVLSAGDFEALVKKLKKAKAFSVDLETTSTFAMVAKIVGISIALKEGQAYYIPVGHSYLGVSKQLGLEHVLDSLKGVLEDKDIKKYGQNIKYDYIVLKQHGRRLEGIYFDTMIASYVLNPSKFNHNLSEIALEYLGYKMTPIEELIGKGAKQVTMDSVDIDKVALYACADADIVLRLEKILSKNVQDKGLESLFFDVEMPLVKILAEMEIAGIKVDVKYLKDLGGDFSKKLKTLEGEIYKKAGQEFNINSPKQLGFILFEKLGLPALAKTKTGYSTQESVLRQLSHMNELPSLVLEYRELAKLQSTYVYALQELADPATHRVHTSFNQTVTATGRLSSSEPNMQNIPIRTEVGRNIRRAFIPDDGCTFLACDYSQIDLRVLAHVSADKNLCDSFSKGEDIHARTASQIFGVSNNKVTEEMRAIAKTVNFGLSYGMGAYGLSRDLGIDVKQAQEYIDSYFVQYEGVKAYIEDTIKDARKKGYVETLLKRRRYLPEISSKNTNMRNFAERMAINTPVQGTSADIIKVAMIRIYENLQKMKFEAKMLLQIHDELIFELPIKEMKNLKKMVQYEMENAVKLDVPVVVDVKIGNNWRDLEKN